MPDYNRSCSAEQLFNFSKQRIEPVGAINALTIGTTTLVADMTVTDPSMTAGLRGAPAVVQAPGALKIVGALTKLKWKSLKDNEPLIIEGAISGKSRKLLMSIIFSSLVDMNVKLSFMIYDYDMASGTYFVGCSSNPHVTGTTPISGLMEKDEYGEISLSVEDEPLAVPQVPTLFPFSIQMYPPFTGPQRVYIALSPTDKLVKVWGRAAGVGF